jgi:hypothetical protein
MVLRLLPLVAGILPLIAMFGAFWLGVHNDVIAACIPFVDGCTSISATGRKPPGSFLFRGIMLPQAAVLIALWYFTVAWLQSLQPGRRPALSTAILVSGMIGALALIIYVTFLGTREPLYEFMRRTGIYFGFLGIALAQLLTAIALKRIANLASRERLSKHAKTMLGLCLTTFALGVINVFFKMTLADADAMENRIEWIASVLMQCYFFVMYLAWRETGVAAVVSVRQA